MNKKSIIGIIIILVLIVLGIYYFNNTKNQQDEVVKIGVILPLTGEAAPYGTKIKDGIQFGYNESNATNIELVFEDSQGMDKNVLSSYNKLISIDNSDIIIGPFGSSSVIALSKKVEKDNVILLAPTATSPEISYAGNNIFRIISSDLFDSLVLSNYIVDTQNQTKMSIVYINNEYGVGFTKAFEESLSKKNIQLLEKYAIESQTKDFKSIINKIKNENNEAIIIVGINEIGYFLKQAKELNLSNQFYSTGMVENPEILDIAGESANGIIYSYPSFDIMNNDSIVSNFVNKYKRSNNVEPSILEALGYDSFNLISSAINNQTKSSVEIRNYFLSLKDYPLVTGEITFDKNGDVIKPIGIKKIENGKFIWLEKKYKF
jgi:branched-chain amino acid transport system substrate-binding protein